MTQLPPVRNALKHCWSEGEACPYALSSVPWTQVIGAKSSDIPTVYSIPALISEPVITMGQKWFRQLQLCSISHCPLGKSYPKSPLPPSSTHLQICFQRTSLSSPVDPVSQKFPKYDTQHISDIQLTSSQIFYNTTTFDHCLLKLFPLVSILPASSPTPRISSLVVLPSFFP